MPALLMLALSCGRLSFDERLGPDAGIDSTDGAPGISHVNGTYGTLLTASSVPISLPAIAVGTGNTVLVTVGTYTDTVAPVVTDSAGNTYTLVVSQLNTAVGGENYSYMYMATIVVGNPADVVSVTPTNYPVVVIDQYAGLTGVVDTTSSGTGGTLGINTASVTTSPFSTTHANDLVYAAMSIDITTEQVLSATPPLVLQTAPPLDGIGQTQGLTSADDITTSILTNATVTMTGTTNGGTGHNDFVIVAVALEGF